MIRRVLSRATIRDRLRLFMLRLTGQLLARAPRRRSNTLRRVLVIKPDHLGDVLLLTPALRVLREQLPHAQITLLVGPWSQQVVARNPDIDDLLTCPFPGFTRAAKSNALQPYLLLFKTASLLRRRGFDAALIARDDHWWGAALVALAGIPQRIGYAVPAVQPFLTTTLPHDPDAHVTQQALGLVEAFTGQSIVERPALRSPVSDADRMWAEQWLAEQGLKDARLAAIHPGTGGQSKLYPTYRWVEVAHALQKQACCVLLTGGTGEQALVEQIAGRLKPSPPLLIGTATVGQLAAVYERCHAVLGVDSGPLHLAASVGVPTVSLFGPSNPRRYGPWGDPERHIVLQSGLWCSPCNDLTACPRGTAPSECMTLIRPPQIIGAVDQATHADVSTHI